MQELEEKNSVSVESKLKKSLKAQNGNGGGGWWERLKNSNASENIKDESNVDQVQEQVDGEVKQKKEFAFGLDLGEDELEDVPW